MNEVTKIHLGRQAFAISTDAHRELRNYLDAIRQRVSDEDVVSEIEMRMAELLTERGVRGEQVILPADVTFLIEQLGDPKDFADDAETRQSDEKPTDTKRLFRDTDNAMIAGVAAGLANYFGIDVLIIRLLFVIATFAGGWGILIYLVLWLLVPEAKTSSDRLQMIGKAVTIDNLRDVVERADVKGAAHRANRALAGPVNTAFTLILRTAGTVLVVIGVSILLSFASGAVYVFLRGDKLTQDSIFPIGFREHLVVYIAAGVVALVSLFVVLFGLALFRRKWPIHAWITGTLIGLLLIGLAVGGALAADVVPQVQDRYNANLHTTVRTLSPFTSVNFADPSGNINVEQQTSSAYSVSLQYYGHPDLHAIKTSVSDKTLNIDASEFNDNRDCPALCLPSSYELTVVVDSPAPTANINSGMPAIPSTPATPTTP